MNAKQTEPTERGASINDMIMSIVETLSILKSELMARFEVITTLQKENAVLKAQINPEPAKNGEPSNNP
jgi:hypothetical protein